MITALLFCVHFSTMYPLCVQCVLFFSEKEKELLVDTVVVVLTPRQPPLDSETVEIGDFCPTEIVLKIAQLFVLLLSILPLN